MLSHVGLSLSHTLKIVCIPKGLGGDRKAPKWDGAQGIDLHITGAQIRRFNT